MTNQIVKALEDGARKLLKTLGHDAGKTVKDFYHSTGKNLETVAKNTTEADAKHADELQKILKGGEKDLPHDPHLPTGRPGDDEPTLGGHGRAGQPSEGNGRCQTAGDPVDVVSGQMITSAVDLTLAGVLPLILRRAYASGYRGGRLHGPGWSSTVDQRVEIDPWGIHFAGDDAQILHYPRPGFEGQAVLPSSGARWPLTWNQDTGVISIEDPDRGWTRHFAPTTGNPLATREIRPITSLNDRNDHRVSFLRDAAGTPTELRHSGDYRVAVDTLHTAAGIRVEGLRLLDGTGHHEGSTIVEYQYYPDGRLAGVVNSSGLPYVYEYDDANRITAWIDRNGDSYEYIYDDHGRVERGIGQDGILSATFRYDTTRRLTAVTDSLGHTTEYHYDERNRVTAIVDPLGHTTRTVYDEHGTLLSRTDEIGRTTHFEVNGHGDPVRITEPDGSSIELDYTALRQLACVRHGGTVTATFDYDPNGNLLTSTDALGAVTTREYDEQGRLRSVTDPLGQVRQLRTNPAGLITAITDPVGRTAHVAYDAYGRVSQFTDPLGAATRLIRRPEGEITERVHPDGTRETWVYDPEGNCTEQRDQAGAVTRFVVGTFGQLTRRILADGEEQLFSYDTELQLLSVATGDAVWNYHYDAAGHLVSEHDFNGRTLKYCLDGADQLLSVTDATGRTTSFSYDLLGQLLERRNHDGSVVTLGYDERGCLAHVSGNGNVLTYTHDAVGRILSESVNGRATQHTYDLLGRRTSRTTPTGLVSTWSYDANHQPVALASRLGTLAFGYDDSGRETTRYLGQGAALTQTWDACNRLSAQSIWSRDTTTQAGDAYTNLRERTYAYRTDGLPSTVTDSLRGRRDFELTPAGRVTRVSARSWNETYAYDPLGNITRAHDTRVPDSATAGERSFDGSLLRTAGRASYDYDDLGRLVRMRVRTLSGQRREWRYSWDAEDQLIGVDTPDQGSWRYEYDPLGRRIAKRRLAEGDTQNVTTEETLFAWDGDQLIEQYDHTSVGCRRTVSWDWEPSSWRAVAQTERVWHPGAELDQPAADEHFLAIVTDLVDAPSDLVTLDGQVVWSADTDLWGRRLNGDPAHAPTCPLGRPGQYHDAETGLEYNHFRYYDPATGRYLSTDPLGLSAGPNPHAYVPNPLFWIDPYGLAKKQPKGWGGWYGKLKPANWTDGSDTNSYEINHIPAQDTWLDLGLPTDLKESTGPAIRMDYDDHRNFISTGSSRASKAWRAKQRSLILQGKFDVAMKMDIGKIRKDYGTKYDAAIKEMVDSLPNNRKFQKYLKDNGWKIRDCLLQ
ncbi:DUF6531 domain-containing protein [Kitasatospora sp. NBC_01250]|uniref:RHS repeat-associated core domain-containing protein n=1 Tax=Kitasatospora sp. NBC_01250 TaxID=2903571 RepID=UPI002E354EFF|nr:RHS repeat-associated core domain-containing protein [Kitasatospora sp. NBC_01250]